MFPGASTMNQLDKVVEVTGLPAMLMHLATCICLYMHLPSCIATLLLVDAALL